MRALAHILGTLLVVKLPATVAAGTDVGPMAAAVKACGPPASSAPTDVPEATAPGQREPNGTFAADPGTVSPAAGSGCRRTVLASANVLFAARAPALKSPPSVAPLTDVCTGGGTLVSFCCPAALASTDVALADDPFEVKALVAPEAAVPSVLRTISPLRGASVGTLTVVSDATVAGLVVPGVA